MKTTKNILSAAIAVAMMGSTGMVLAVSNLDDGTGVYHYANEGAVVAGSDDFVTHNLSGGVRAKLGFSVSDAESKYVRFDFPTAFALFVGEYDFAISGTPAPITIVNGGEVGDKHVILKVTASAGTSLTQNDTVTYLPLAPPVTKVVDEKPYQVTFGLYEDAVHAVNKTSALRTVTGTWFDWQRGLNASCTAANPRRIDATAPKKWEDQTGEGRVSTDVFRLKVDAVPNTWKPFVSFVEQVDIFDYFANFGFDMVVSGSQAGLDLFMAIPAEAIPADNVDTNVSPTISIWHAVPPMPSENYAMQAVNTGKADMVSSTYSVVFKQTGTPNIPLPNRELDLGVCGKLEYTGSRDRADVLLTPGAARAGFARITNPSEIAGKVVVKLWNDAGDSVTFPMSNINGISNDTLAAGASTDMVSIEDVFAAAQAADSTFALTSTSKGRKLRMEVRGEFGENAKRGSSEFVAREVNGISLQVLSLSKDRNSFVLLKN